MSKNKFSFKSIYYLHVELNNYHVFITIGAHVILSNIDFFFCQLIFTEITYTQSFIFKIN